MMNCLRLVCVFAFASLAPCVHAQPLQPQTGAKKKQVGRPEDAVRWLTRAFNGEGRVRGRGEFVVGAIPNDPALDEVDKEIERNRGDFLLSVSDFQKEINGKTARITFKTTLRNRLLNQITQTEQLKLQQFETQDKTFWKVVPGQPEAVVDDENSGILLKLATLIAFPQETLALYRIDISHSNLFSLAGVLLGFAQDHDDRLPILGNSFHKDLSPYSKSEQNFYATAERNGGVSYSFNANLSGVNLKDIAKPENTVMLYEGKDGQLNFRHNNRAIVAFVDGLIQLVTREEAKSLKWQPFD